mmetsp:Transcript_21566/g.83900  ORF Transcript_21566/g.83900 Transcript_21566/m.83900 type:complete len:295 (-) Transcript_21566:225-1109(-)
MSRTRPSFSIAFCGADLARASDMAGIVPARTACSAQVALPELVVAAVALERVQSGLQALHEAGVGVRAQAKPVGAAGFQLQHRLQRILGPPQLAQIPGRRPVQQRREFHASGQQLAHIGGIVQSRFQLQAGLEAERLQIPVGRRISHHADACGAELVQPVQPQLGAAGELVEQHTSWRDRAHPLELGLALRRAGQREQHAARLALGLLKGALPGQHLQRQRQARRVSHQPQQLDAEALRAARVQVVQRWQVFGEPEQPRPGRGCLGRRQGGQQGGQGETGAALHGGREVRAARV